MVRTQISLTEEQLRRLRRRAADRGTSIAAIIRELVDRELRVDDRGSQIARALSAAGCFDSGLADLADRHDQEFRGGGRRLVILLDTSAVVDLLDAGSRRHELVRTTFADVAGRDRLVLHNYLTLECVAVLQRRGGMRPVRQFLANIVPIVEMVWVDEAMHERAVARHLATDQRELSLVDCTSFEVMREHGIGAAFTFDPHFVEHGFDVIP